MKKTSNRCYCGSQRLRSRCCEPYLLAAAVAPTAEALMRSRYSAFCTGHVDYLMATHHPTASAPNDRAGLIQTLSTTEWINLLVLDRQKGQKKDKTGIVEFVAAYRPRLGLSLGSALDPTFGSNHKAANHEASKAMQLHERSRFIWERGQWFYLDGKILPPYQPKRSHPCWCGSEKPFKHCHG